MTYRQSKLPLALRIIAAGCVVLWLAGVSACNLEAFFCCESQGNEAVAHTDEGHLHREHAAVAEAHHPHDADSHPHDSHKHDGKEGSCCSTLKAVVQTANPVVFSKLDFHPIPVLCVLLETHAASLSLSETPPNRQAKPRDGVFTPEVCLGPAHLSLAPPFSLLS